MYDVGRRRVSSLRSEAEAEARMLVYSPVEEMEFIQRRLSGEACPLSIDNGRNFPGGYMNLSCLVRGVHPLPQVKLTLGEFDLGQVGLL